MVAREVGYDVIKILNFRAIQYKNRCLKKYICRQWYCNIIYYYLKSVEVRVWSSELKKVMNFILQNYPFPMCEQPAVINFRCFHFYLRLYGKFHTRIHVHVQARSMKIRRNHMRSSVLPRSFFKIFCVSYNDWWLHGVASAVIVSEGLKIGI